VPPADLPAYDSALRKLKDKLGYTFTFHTPDQLAVVKEVKVVPGAGQLNWPIALLLGVVVGGAGIGAVRYFQASKLPSSRPPSLHHSSLEGLSGWLILVAIGLILRPFILLHADVTVFQIIFHMDRWQNLTQVGQPAYHPYWMPVLLFELLYNSLAAVFAALLIFLFFSRAGGLAALLHRFPRRGTCRDHDRCRPGGADPGRGARS